MSFYLSLVPLLIVAQVCGIGAAWLIDRLSWRWRKQNDSLIFFSGLALVVFYVCFGHTLGFRYFADLALLSIFYVGVLSLVQARQFRERWVTAFWGALLQHWCFLFGFVVSTMGFFFILISCDPFGTGERVEPPLFLFLASLVVTQLLFTFCRRTVDLAGRQAKAFTGEKMLLRWRRSRVDGER